ncbi:hypothetical protein [Sorangium atrum]|uniref:Uncharacterized protein n=1 Tax=Sorangium atrum TaxID=2995308 RepID=A0ABT5BZ31_9BACT|nr:hypothetical protein [Sorangium aterium]MDC0678216.1 hypothetical protein [Sorangium aterium]
MGVDKTHDPPGAPRPGHAVSEEKRPLPQADVPGVRGPITPSGELEDTPPDEVDSWGSEGGAGSYAGGPIISTTKISAPRPPRASG